VAILVSLAVFAVVGLITRRSALGMLLESIGVNPEASRLAGVRYRTIVFAVYVFSALCAGVAGLMIASNISAADANNAGLWIEMDAILAVVIGGTSLLGGRFSLTGTILGALIIQTLTTTVYTAGITPETTLVFKAVVVIAVCLLQAPKFRQLLRRRRRIDAPVPRAVPGPGAAALDKVAAS
jgi:simple sugar transport system permease protein